MQRTIVLERYYPHPPERVWRAITDPSLIERWMLMKNDFKAEVGHRFELHDVSGNWDGFMTCEVIDVQAPHKLVYSFMSAGMQSRTLVHIQLSATDEGTHLKLEHSGFTGLRDMGLSFIIGMGWRRMLKALQDVIV